MDSSIKNVAVAGASGNLGSELLSALFRQKQFNVTILARRGRESVRRPSVVVRSIDYDSLDSLVDALGGQDAVVSALSRDAIPLQLKLAEAAAITGVKRFIPSEFGANLQDPNTRQLLNNKAKVEVEEYLEQICSTCPMTYTFMYNNVFLDWGLQMGMIIDIKNGSARLFDGGNRRVSMCRVATVAKAIVGVLSNPSETVNRALHIQEAVVSQMDLLEHAKELFQHIKWQVSVVDTAEQVKEVTKILESGQTKPGIFHIFAVRGGFSEGFGNQFDDTDSKMLGIEPMSASEIRQLLTEIAKE